MRKSFLSGILFSLILVAFLMLPAFADPLTAEARDGKTELTVNYGETITLYVEASGGSGEYRYNWLKRTEYAYWSNSYQSMPSQRDASITVGPITENSAYRCAVFDSVNASNVDVAFQINVENGLTARDKNPDQSYQVLPGDSLTCEVEASCTSGDLTYLWYSSSPIQLIPGSENSPRYVWNDIKKPTYIICVIRDRYNNYAEVRFDAKMDSFDNELQIIPISPSTVYVEEGGSVTFSVNISCKQGGMRCNWSYKYDGSSNRWHTSSNAGDTWTFEDIEQNAMVRCNVYDDYGHSKFVTFNVVIGKEPKELSLRKGWTVEFPQSVAYGEVQSLEIIESAPSRIGTVSGKKLKVSQTGEGTVKVNYSSGDDFFHFIVHDKPDPFTLPADTQIISYEAFSGNRSITALTLGEDVQSVESKAFYGTSIAHITVLSKDTDFASDAFSTSPFFVCLKDSAAEKYARQNNYTYIYLIR